MKVYYIIFFLFVIKSSPIDGASPGVQMSVESRGLELAKDVVVKNMAASLASLHTGQITFHNGEVDDLRTTSFQLGRTSISSSAPNKVTLVAYGTNIALAANWRYTLKIGFKVKFKGSVTMNANGIDISQTVGLGMDSQGKPMVLPGACSASISSLSYKLHGDVSVKIIDALAGFFEHKMKKIVQGKICPSIQSFMNDFDRTTLATLNVDLPIMANINIDMSLTRAPEATASNVTAFFEGRCHTPKSVYPHPIPPIPELKPTSQMARCVVTDYVIKTLFYSMYSNGNLNWTFTQPMLDKIMGYNVTASKLAWFVPTLNKFINEPNDLVVKIYALSPPSANFSSSGIHFEGPFMIEIYVIINGTLFPIFKHELNIDMLNKLIVENSAIVAKVDNLKFVTKSPGLPAEIFDKLLNAAVPSAVLPAINRAVGSVPLFLHNALNFQLTNLTIHFDAHVIIFDTDVSARS